MPRLILDGECYKFSRPQGYYEVGRLIHEDVAQTIIRFGGDVYTPRASDAKSLAKKISSSPPTWHPAHSEQYFPHYHPGPGYGHIFYGTRGEDF